MHKKVLLLASVFALSISNAHAQDYSYEQLIQLDADLLRFEEPIEYKDSRVEFIENDPFHFLLNEEDFTEFYIYYLIARLFL